MQRIKQSIEFSLAIVIIILGTSGIIFSVKAYPEVFKTTIAIEKEIGIRPNEAVIINFSESMIPESVSDGIKILPTTEAELQWKDNNKKLLIVPVDYWKPGEKYQISIESARNIMFLTINADFSFQTISYPQVESTTPLFGEKDVVVDIEDPIRIVFNESLSNFQVKFIISPLGELVYQLNTDNKTVDLMPKNSLNKGEKYTLETFVRYKDEIDYRKINETYFETKPAPPNQWDQNLDMRLGQARRFTDPQINEGKYIDINLKSQVMIIFENGSIIDSFIVSSGKKGMDTPQGSYQIYNKYPKPWSKKYKLFMPYWMAITSSGSYGIHELPEWPNGYKEGANHLGIPVSHGCVRLGVGAAEKIYNWAEIGTPVIIHS